LHGSFAKKRHRPPFHGRLGEVMAIGMLAGHAGEQRAGSNFRRTDGYI
jgi:hypothetical protein